MNLERQRTPDLGRDVFLRPGTSDRQTWSDTFTGRYHVPPADMPTPNRVLDLGANIGLTAAHYQAMWPHACVVAVEMDPGNAALIAENAPLSPVRNVAVTGVAGFGTYDTSLHEEAYSFEPGFITPAEVDGRRRVYGMSLAEIIEYEWFPEGTADFVKMDVEGAEWGLFAHLTAWAPLVSHFVVELHGEGESEFLVESAVRRLTGAGFEARHHPPHPQAVYAWRP